MVRTDEVDGWCVALARKQRGCTDVEQIQEMQEACNAYEVLMGNVMGLPRSDSVKKKEDEKGDGGL